MADKETAYVLPLEAAGSTETQVVAGHRFTPDEPVAISDMGLSADEAKERFAESPLKKTTAKAKRREDAPVSAADVASAPVVPIAESEAVEGSPYPGLSKEEYDAKRKESPSVVTDAMERGGTPASEVPAEEVPLHSELKTHEEQMAELEEREGS